MSLFGRWKAWARRFQVDAYAVHIAARDARVPWYAKALALTVAAYAFSPIDLIPDIIPVLGYLDDLLILPLGIAVVVRLVPDDVWEECRESAEERTQDRRLGWMAAAAVLLLWTGLAWWIWSLLSVTPK